MTRAEGILIWMDGKFYYATELAYVRCKQCGHNNEIDVGEFLMDHTEDV